MSATARTNKGRFPPGVSGNRKGRPTNIRRIREQYEADLLALGATKEDIDTLLDVSSDKAKGVAAVVALAATVVDLIHHSDSVRRNRFNQI
ncbi:hypothetical protein G7047_05005 [Diaphorobacter sp. HDW4A]|uniref:hypothetical protein n=1 Tax=Diaphorobacter sp. HDW4A TaxID=2714924 RepID=UPI00140D2359|nr:hypothetical protein [Diaphorobacter sp. HDW4A]QIL79335.1 hypothetical protein G7047_05005 [Diaphorobacter sp. HDW4A]